MTLTLCVVCVVVCNRFGPPGVVCDREKLAGREVVVVANGRALMLCPSLESLDTADPDDVEIVHPNEDGAWCLERCHSRGGLGSRSPVRCGGWTNGAVGPKEAERES